MKIASYNIMAGGFKSYEDEGRIPQRMDLVVEAVRVLGADLVTLIDTFRWNDLFSDAQLLKLFGYKKIFRIILEDDHLQKKGWDNGMVVMTNHNEVAFEQISLGNRNAIKSEIIIGDKKVNLFSIYLNDKDEDIRLGQLSTLFTHINKEDPTVVAGDLNTIDKGDWSRSGSEILHFFASFPTLKPLEPALAQMERGEVTARLRDLSLVDADEVKRRKTIPSKLFPVATLGPILRLDYAFYNNKVRVHDFEVMMGAPFETTSDHYPIRFEIE